jgi:hypothetical protein
VTIHATYTDYYPKGTGIQPLTCKVYVDNVNKSKPAVIGNYSLRLQLKNVPNGDHTYKLELRDRAGNLKTVERKFTVAVASPTSSPTPTSQPTYNPLPTYHPTYIPPHTTTPLPTGTPTLYPTLTPTPTTSGSPIIGPAVPSPSGSPSPSATGSGGGSAAGFVGGTLLAMLPVGAVVSYLILHRREDALSEASAGAVLSGGGSAWDKVKGTFSRAGDIFKPTNRS